LFNPYAHTISHIKLGLARKAFFCNIICTMQSLKVLHLFKYLRIVRRFVHHEHNCFRVYLTYNKFFQPLRTIKIYYKLKQQISISLKSLQWSARSIKNSLLILDTPYGLLTHKHALKLKIGGVLVCTLN